MPQPKLRVFVFTVSGRECPLERYEISNLKFEDARYDAVKQYGRKYGLSVIGPAFDIKFENPDA